MHHHIRHQLCLTYLVAFLSLFHKSLFTFKEIGSLSLLHCLLVLLCLNKQNRDYLYLIVRKIPLIPPSKIMKDLL